MIKEFEKKTGIKILEISAKSGEGVDEAFKTVVKNLITKKYICCNFRERKTPEKKIEIGKGNTNDSCCGK